MKMKNKLVRSFIGVLIVGGSVLGPAATGTVVASAEPCCDGNDVDIKGRTNYLGKLIANAIYRSTPAKAPY